MDFPSILTRNDEQAARLIEQALVAVRQGGFRMPSLFIEGLFRRIPAEDLITQSAEALVQSATAAFAAMEKRYDGEPCIKVTQPSGDAAFSYLTIANDNMPFLVDSVMAELAEQGIDIRLVTHPIFQVERLGDGTLSALVHDDNSGKRESLIHIHVGRLDDPARIEALIAGLQLTLADVRLAVTDWPAMMARVTGCIADLKANPALPVTEIAEAIQFLEWLKANHFTFLGIRDYAYSGTDETAAMQATATTGLGVLADPDLHVLRRGREIVVMTPEMDEFLRQPVPLIITKANARSRVHRRVPMDYIGVKRFSETGDLLGETRIVGLFASAAYTDPVKAIPFLRRKYNHVMTHSGFDANSHSGKALANVLDHYPRDELYQIDETTLQQFCGMILQLVERPRVRVLPRIDRFDRFVSVLVYVPRDRYDTDIQRRIGDYLATAFKGRVSAFYPYLPEGQLARIHYIIGRYEGETPVVPRNELENAVGEIVRVWSEGLGALIAEAQGTATARSLMARYGGAFSGAYRETSSYAAAIRDIGSIETLGPAQPFALDFYRDASHDSSQAGLKMFASGAPLPLSRRVPVLEAMGFEVVDERTYEVKPVGHPAGTTIWLHDMALRRADGQSFDLAALDEKLEQLLTAILRGETESDGFNALVLEAGLNWRDVGILRALAHFMRQIRLPFGPDYLWTTLRRYPQLAKALVVLFHVRFDPRPTMDWKERGNREAEVIARIEDGLKTVTALDEDRIIRQFMALVRAILRTNFFQTDETGAFRPVIAMKFASRTLDAIPEPRPLYEIFLDSPRVEGVHLRFGMIARGGIRWSDRAQDFRTEVLGLVKAQQVKNAVIVPVGAKGGFLPKNLPPTSQRDAWLAEGTASYRIFIRSLLDLTDNIVADAIVPPPNTIRYDGDDPYLVVAADKGTATFSDTANAISLERGHWLGDAFASGGSNGYDHKKMGITARGAFKAVERHFREMDIDIARRPFTVAGVGDMSGDVFGNGMLLSPVTKLVAAFDHRDIFIDPNPDMAVTFAERQRLFNLPRSSWQDFDKTKISAGGGIFSRSEKSIALSPEIRSLLDIEKPAVTPQDLMIAILKARVDLLWFGGIGTYIRATTETDAEAGDRANDAIRITGVDVRAKVVGEGANLGATQKGRIEAAANGVRLNTDAIDNSAGVNTSDVEVNLKIALSRPVREGKLNEADRSTLLASMTEDVARLVLRNNELQTLALSLAQRRTVKELGLESRFMKALAKEGRLDRHIEFLPDDAEIATRARSGRGLTRPELAVLLAYAKLTLFDDLIDTKVPDDPYLRRDLVRYFPSALEERFPDAISNHRLQREIIATMLGNSIINRGGPTFVFRLADATGASLATIAAAFALTRDSFGLTAFNDAIDRLDSSISGEIQLDLYAEIQELLLDRTLWFIAHTDLEKGLEAQIMRFRKGIAGLAQDLAQILPPAALAACQSRQQQLMQAGLPQALADRFSTLPWLAAAPDCVLIAESSHRSLRDAGLTLFGARELFSLDSLRTNARAIVTADEFERLALGRALSAFAEAERAIALSMLKSGKPGPEAISHWQQVHQDRVERSRAMIAEMAMGGLSLSKLTVAAGLLGDLARMG